MNHAPPPFLLIPDMSWITGWLLYTYVCENPVLACPNSAQIPLTPGVSHLMMLQDLKRHLSSRNRIKCYGWKEQLQVIRASDIVLKAGIWSRGMEWGLMRGEPESGPVKKTAWDRDSSYLSLNGDTAIRLWFRSCSSIFSCAFLDN